jgi:AraC-like DNA-binding protein
MKITATGPGIMADFSRAIGATVSGRFTHIPASQGGGYITGFVWGNELRTMIRHYYLKEDISIEWTNAAMARQEHVVFLLSGIFPSLLQPDAPVVPEQARILICRQHASSVISMPSNTLFGSVTIGVSQAYLRQLFGHLAHPVVASVLAADDDFVLETGIDARIINAASLMLPLPVPESLASQYYRLKCEELLCYTMALLMQREALPLSRMHIDDIRAVYAVKLRLQAAVGAAPGIAALAREAGMSAPKLRKLFRQTFGTGVFDYYQALRMQEAVRLLKEQHLSVAEVGYRLGFTNLSHFARVFEAHTGLKPKKFSAA